MNPQRPFLFLPMLVIGTVVSMSGAKAEPILLDGTWMTLVGPEDSPLPTADAPYLFSGAPWTMSLTVPMKLTVTDWLAAGDLFEVYNYNVLLGKGPAVPISGAYATTPDLALGNAKFSQNYWILQPGDYALTFGLTKFAPTYTNGTIAFNVDRLPLPETGATLILFGATLIGIAGIRAVRWSGMCVG
ncbi:MAG: hypothetical protein V4584_13795 [Verrucomicrobiota bacterium]